MKLKSYLPTLALLLLSSGCAVVPSTKIILTSPNGQKVSVDSPKETSWTDVDVMLSSDGVFRFKVGSVKAANQADVVKIVTDSNERMFNKGLDVGKALIGTVAPLP